jgi:DNA (cytosine-5)-methyltransferase 1
VIKVKIQTIDLFCGAGGLTHGMRNVNIPVVAGFDLDNSCKYAYEFNNVGTRFYNKNIEEITGETLNSIFDQIAIRVLVGCAPCQSFSSMTYKWGNKEKTDIRWNLLLEFGRIIRECTPDIISMENVPGLEKTNVFTQFLHILDNHGYKIDYKIIHCPKYGIPQNRRRLVLLASKLGSINIIPETHNSKNYQTVRQYIEYLPPIEAGKTCKSDPLHRSSSLSDLNLKRIKKSKPGGSWRDWEIGLRTNCHKKESGSTYSSVYARMEWDKVAPTITTQFNCYGTGRFGHPDQNRALSLREGALLQTFPKEYQFFDNHETNISIRTVAKHIGNAVPVRLGEIIGLSILAHLEEI